MTKMRVYITRIDLCVDAQWAAVETRAKVAAAMAAARWSLRLARWADTLAGKPIVGAHLAGPVVADALIEMADWRTKYENLERQMLHAKTLRSAPSDPVALAAFFRRLSEVARWGAA